MNGIVGSGTWTEGFVDGTGYVGIGTTVTGSYGSTQGSGSSTSNALSTPVTPSDIYSVSQAYGTMSTITSIASFGYWPAGVISLLQNMIAGNYADFNQELYQQGYPANADLRVVSTMQVMGNGEIMEIENYYNSNGDLIKTLRIPR